MAAGAKAAQGPVFIGTAGWAIPLALADRFPASGSGLSRYGAIFNAAEINSTFVRKHRDTTLERWRDSVPDHFRFSVKVPKQVTHELGLANAGSAFEEFVRQISLLGTRLGPLLLQLPPKLAFDARVVEAFLREAKSVTDSDLVIEPRQASWFSSEADGLLAAHGVARAGADPERAGGALQPGGSQHMSYLRLHGSPRVYYSEYGEQRVTEFADLLAASPPPAWCIFDNTASGAGAGDALLMRRLFGERLNSNP